MKKKKTSITLSNDLLEKLKAAAAKRRWGLSKLIQVGLELGLDQMLKAIDDAAQQQG